MSAPIIGDTSSGQTGIMIGAALFIGGEESGPDFMTEPDEVADAVVFLASPLARAITGQCLDVNCGEYHH